MLGEICRVGLAHVSGRPGKLVLQSQSKPKGLHTRGAMVYLPARRPRALSEGRRWMFQIKTREGEFTLPPPFCSVLTFNY